MANKSVFGIYNTRADAERGIDRLRAAGFRATDISVLLPENLGNKDIAVKGASKAPEGATAGGVSGATVGGADSRSCPGRTCSAAWRSRALDR